jgi:uncharacterized protein involved in high-affinity Fe2+ transport
MDKILGFAFLVLVAGISAHAENCSVDADAHKGTNIGSAMGEYCPFVTIESDLTTNVKLTDSSNGMCAPMQSLIVNSKRFDLYRFDVKLETSGYGVGCHFQTQFVDGTHRELLLQVNED